MVRRFALVTLVLFACLLAVENRVGKSPKDAISQRLVAKGYQDASAENLSGPIQSRNERESFPKRLVEMKEKIKSGERGFRKGEKRRTPLSGREGKQPKVSPQPADSLNCRLLGKIVYPPFLFEYATSCVTDPFGNYSYVGGESEFGNIVILNTSDPSSIQLTGSLMTGIYWLPSLFKEGDYLYAVGEGEAGGELAIVDVSDPQNPNLVGSLRDGAVSCFYDVMVQGDYAYIGDRNGFRVVDVSDPESPQPAAYLNYGEPCWNIYLSGSYAYLIEDWTRFRIIEISDPTNPQEKGLLTIPEIWDCAVFGDYAYVGGEEGLYLVDISDPEDPQILNSFPEISGFLMEISGDYLYLVGEAEETGWGIFIFDLQNPISPNLVAWFEPDLGLEDGDGLSVQNQMIYLAGEDLFQIFDATDFGPPVIGSSGNWSGSGIDLQGNYAYCLSLFPSELHIVDISNPAAPNELGSCNTSYPLDIDLLNNYAYVAEGEAGLRIYNISSPTNPFFVGEYNTNGFASGVFVQGNLAYVADGAEGLLILNVSNPANPTYLGSFSGIDAQKVFVSGTYAYLAGNNGFWILDVSDPENPSGLGSWQDGFLYDVYVSGGYAYLVGYDLNYKPLFAIFDVSDPGVPGLVGSLRERGYSVLVQGGYAYLSASEGLKIIHISDPRNPERVGIANASARDARVIGNYGYLVGYGLKVVDLTDPTGGIYLAGEYELEEWENAIYDLSVSGLYGYAASDSGFQCLKIIPRNNPQGMGTYPLRRGRALDMKGNYAYLLDYESLYVIDATNPTNPGRVSSYPGRFSDIKIAGDYAYLSHFNTLIVLNTATRPPSPVGSLALEGSLHNIAISGSYAYITGNHNISGTGFFVIEISDPENPGFVNFVQQEGYPSKLFILDNRLYIVSGHTGLYIYDITAPGAPTLLGRYQESGWFRDVAVVKTPPPTIKSYAFLITSLGLRVVDVTNPESPSLFGYYTPAVDEYYCLALSGPYAYIGSLFGFSIIEADIPGFSEIWQKLPEISGQPSGKNVKGGGGITGLGENLYLLLGNNTRDFLRYSPTSNSWTALCSLPAGERNKRVKKGAYIVDDETYVYAFKGGGTNEFYKYDPASNSWSSLNEPGFAKGMRGGFASYVNYTGNYIYAGSGASNNEWKRFNIGDNTWEPATPTTLPAEKVKVGSGLTFDGVNRLYFLLGGGKKNYFWYCNLSAETPEWIKVCSLPLIAQTRKKKVKEGGCIEFFDGKVYAVKGGNTKEFWSYDPTSDNWTYLGEIEATKGIKCGRSLTSNDLGIYCLIGNNTNEVFYYGISALAKLLEPSTMGRVSLNREITFTALPNPTRGLVNIQYSLPKDEFATFKVYNVLGEVVYSRKGKSGQFTIKNLPAGIYLLRFEAKGDKEERKLIVVK